MKYVDDIVCDAIGSMQFGGIAGTSTTDALVAMIHIWYEATDTFMSVLSCYILVKRLISLTITYYLKANK